MLELVEHLDRADVRYCHWKSNLAIDRSASGENDLDLLIARSDANAFVGVLHELGFVRTTNPLTNVPGTASYYRYSEAGRRWINVHAHYQLVLGHDRTKNYRVPIEDAYLASATRLGIFPVPRAELEYVLLVIRLVLKYAIWDEIAWNQLRGNPSHPKESEQAELDELAARVDHDEVATAIKEHLPYLDPQLFAACEAALRADTPITSRVRAAARLERALQPFARSSPAADAWFRLSRRFDLAARRRLGHLPGNRPASGGAVVAIIGGDGSGKTTAVTDAVGWLRAAIDVRQIHLGKPPWSYTTQLTRAAAKGVALAVAALDRTAPSPLTARLVETVTTYRPLLWHLCAARDRRLTYAGARRFVDRGGIVISDRYPHPLLHLMDVPQISRTTAGQLDTALVRAMSRAEIRSHDSIAPPTCSPCCDSIRRSPLYASRKNPPTACEPGEPRSGRPTGAPRVRTSSMQRSPRTRSRPSCGV